MKLTGFDNLGQGSKNAFGIGLDDQQMASLARYAEELLAWNERINLTRITEPEAVRDKHFLDSLSCLTLMGDGPYGRVIDVGTGGGFPGLVLRIVRPEMQLTLADSVSKKTGFLEHIVQDLRLEDVQVVTARAEKLGQDRAHREVYDWAVARALASLPVLLEYLLPLVKVGGAVLAMKGAEVGEELTAAQNALAVLGGEVVAVLPVEIPGGEGHTLVLVRKVRPTPEKYPRREGMPNKRPL